MHVARPVLLLSVALCLFTAAVASGQIWTEDFDAMAPGSFPTGWTLDTSGYGAPYQFVDTLHCVTPSNSFKLEGAQGYTASAHYPVPYSYPYVELEADVLPTEVSPASWGDNVAFILFGAFDCSPNVGVWFGPSHTGSRLWTPNGPYDDTNGPQYAQGEWHHVRIVADFALRTFSVWVDDAPLETNTPMSSDCMYPVLQLGAGNSTHTQVWFDNVSMCWDAPSPVEEVSWSRMKTLYR